MLTFTQFKQSLAEDNPPKDISVYLQALWYDAKNNWHKAHDLINDMEDNTAAWIHAYLHRKEGDISNAHYWYNRANKTMPLLSLDTEWEDITDTIINENNTA